MKSIYKYPLIIADRQSVPLHAGAQVLSVQTQYGQPCLWALVDTENPIVNRQIALIGTGNTIHGDDLGRFIGTVQLQEGTFVLHAFECESKG